MRFKRVNTLAMDVSAVPSGDRLATVRPFLGYIKVDPSKLKSVQVHSSKKLIYVSLPDDCSAAAIAAKTPRFTMTFNGVKQHVPVTFVDEDVIDVRVSDLPPETPNHIIQDVLRQYGDVLSVTDETWKDFFPGVRTGVRIARMKLSSSLGSYVEIGEHRALIHYAGMTRTCRRCGADSHLEKKCPRNTAGETKKTPQQNSKENMLNDNNKVEPARLEPQAKRSKVTDKQQQNSISQPHAPASRKQQQKQTAAATDNRSEIPMELGDARHSSGFTVVARRRGRVALQQQPDPSEQNTITTPSDCVTSQMTDGEQKIADFLLNVAKTLGMPEEEVEKMRGKT